MATVKQKALANKRKPAQMEEQDYRAMVDEDREEDMTDQERGERAAAQAVNTAREDANSAFKSGGRMQNEEFNRSSKARAEALAKKRKNK